MGISLLEKIFSVRFSIPIIIILGVLSRLFSEYYFSLIVAFSFIISPVVIYVLITESKFIWLILFVTFIIGGSLLFIYFSYNNIMEFHTSLLLASILFLSFYSALRLSLNSWIHAQFNESEIINKELNEEIK